MSDYKSAALIIYVLTEAKILLADKGYNADWLLTAQIEHDIVATIPS